MRILAISPTSGLSGVDQTFRYLCTGLASMGAEVTAVLPPNAETKNDLIAGGVDVDEVRHMHWWFPVGFSDEDVSRAVDRSRISVRQLLRIISQINPDVVISNTSVSLDGVMAAMISGTPHVTHLHALFVDNIFTQMSASFKNAVYGLLAGPGSAMVVPAAEIKRQIAELVPHSVDYIFPIPNGIDVERFRPAELQPSGETRIVSLGHFNDNKNQLMLVDVAREMKERGIDNFTFVLAGPAETVYLSMLRNRIDDNNVTSHFEILDAQSDVLPLLQSSHIYTNSSTTETFPVSVLEAMASGLPCVCTPTVGAREIVDSGVTGYIGQNVRELADHLIMLINDPGKRNDMGRAARAKIETLYSSEVFARKFFDVVRRVGGSNSLRPTPWLGKVFFGKPLHFDVGDVKRIAIIIPDWSLTSCVLLIKKPFEYIKERNFDVDVSVYSYGEIPNINLDEIDLLYVFRLYVDPVPALVKQAKLKGIPIIFETDDNYFALKFEAGEVVHGSVSNPALESVLEDADTTIVYSQTMQEDALRFTKCVTRLRPYQLIGDTPTKDDNGQIIGFMGTLKKDVDFEFIVPALQRLLEERPHLRLEFFGFIPDALSNNPRVSQKPFDPNYDSFIRFFRGRRWTVGLAPLADNAFNRSKTNNKYREYSAAGYAGVYSNVPPYADCVIDQETGLLVNNDTEAWYDAIVRLLDDAELRSKIIDSAYDDVKKTYRFKDHVNSKLEIVRKLLDSGGREGAGLESRLSRAARMERTWSAKSTSRLCWPVTISGKPFHSLVMSFKGVIAGIELIPLDFIKSSDSEIGVEVVYENEIIAHVTKLTVSMERKELTSFAFGKPVAVDGVVEIRVFARSPVARTKIMGVLGRRGPKPLLALLH